MGIVTSQKSTFSWGVQADKNTLPTKWYRHKALRSTMTEVDDTRMLDPEMGGVAAPDGMYKVGTFANGDASIQPRLASTVGWLFKAAAGSVTSTADTPETGVTQHEFDFGLTECLPYIAIRQDVPSNCDGSQQMGRVFYGARIIGLQFDFTVEKPLTMTMAVRGLNWQFEDPSSWSYENAFEPYGTMPLGVQDGAYIKIPGFSSDPLPVVQATVAYANNPQDIRLERVYGKTGLDDVSISDHVMTIDAIIKFDPALYRTILTGSATGTAWSSQVFEHDFEATAVAPAKIGTTNTNYTLKFVANRVVWRINGGLTMAGRDAVMMRLTGAVLMNAAGTEYAKLYLYNDTSAYA